MRQKPSGPTLFRDGAASGAAKMRLCKVSSLRPYSWESRNKGDAWRDVGVCDLGW